MSKILSIVVPVFNKYNFTKSCLQDLCRLTNDHEIIVVDNGSTDQTEAALKDSKEIVYKRLHENTGFAKACNYGYAWAKSPNVMFLNNDSLAKKETRPPRSDAFIPRCAGSFLARDY